MAPTIEIPMPTSYQHPWLSILFVLEGWSRFLFKQTPAKFIYMGNICFSSFSFHHPSKTNRVDTLKCWLYVPNWKHLKTLKFRSVFRNRSLLSSHVFADSSVFRNRSLLSSHVFADGSVFLIPGSVRAASPFCWWPSFGLCLSVLHHLFADGAFSSPPPYNQATVGRTHSNTAGKQIKANV